MHRVYWAKSQSQPLLPTTLMTAVPSPRAGDWRLGAAVLTCGVIFLIDVAIPGVIVGLLYSLVIVGLARAGRAWWLAAVCALGTLLHGVAGYFDQPAAELAVIVANRGLAVLVLWGIGGWIAFNLAASGQRASAGWRAARVD